MKIDTLVTILLEELDASAEDDRYRLSDGQKVTLLVRGADSVIPLHKVRRLRITDEFVKVSTDECAFFVDVDSIVALRLDDPEVGGEKRPGFH